MSDPQQCSITLIKSLLDIWKLLNIKVKILLNSVSMYITCVDQIAPVGWYKCFEPIVEKPLGYWLVVLIRKITLTVINWIFKYFVFLHLENINHQNKKQNLFFFFQILLAGRYWPSMYQYDYTKRFYNPFSTFFSFFLSSVLQIYTLKILFTLLWKRATWRRYHCVYTTAIGGYKLSPKWFCNTVS